MELRVYAPEYRPERGNLRTRILQAKHDRPTAGHFGCNKTLELLRSNYVWPSMRSLTVRPVRSQQILSPSSLPLATTFTGPRAPMARYQYGIYRAVTCV